MDLGLSGKVAIVTGGASNIGRCISRRLAGEGAVVAILDLDATSARRTVEDIEKQGGTACFFEADVADLEKARAAVTAVRREIGEVEILINNVGWSGRLGYFLSIEPERWDKAYRLNLLPTFNMTRQVLPMMVEQRRGAIVSVSSDAGFGMTHTSEYGAMKAGVMSFSRSIAIEYGRYGIRSNAVAPGLVIPKPEDMGNASFWNWGIGYTEKEIGVLEAQVPMRERPTAEDIGAAAVFLASEPARMLSGQVLSVSGGFMMPR